MATYRERNFDPMRSAVAFDGIADYPGAWALEATWRPDTFGELEPVAVTVVAYPMLTHLQNGTDPAPAEVEGVPAGIFRKIPMGTYLEMTRLQVLGNLRWEGRFADAEPFGPLTAAQKTRAVQLRATYDGARSRLPEDYGPDDRLLKVAVLYSLAVERGVKDPNKVVAAGLCVAPTTARNLVAQARPNGAGYLTKTQPRVAGGTLTVAAKELLAHTDIGRWLAPELARAFPHTDTTTSRAPTPQAAQTTRKTTKGTTDGKR